MRKEKNINTKLVKQEPQRLNMGEYGESLSRNEYHDIASAFQVISVQVVLTRLSGVRQSVPACFWRAI